MDRNNSCRVFLLTTLVALRKESVDRNGSLCWLIIKIRVALRKESVDRNYIIKITGTAPRRSLSARRAWIEICGGVSARLLVAVALRKESVDRNLSFRAAVGSRISRSPQGERG